MINKKKLTAVISALGLSTAIFGSAASATTYTDTAECTWGYNHYQYCNNNTYADDFDHKTQYYVDKVDSNSYYVNWYKVDPGWIGSTADPYWGTTYVLDANEIIYDDSISGFFRNNTSGIVEQVDVTLESDGGVSYPYGYVEILHGVSGGGVSNDKTRVYTYFDPDW
ncbi:hypothetical protein ACQ0QQ_08395 [Lysinibacillus sphaericus]